MRPFRSYFSVLYSQKKYANIRLLRQVHISTFVICRRQYVEVGCTVFLVFYPPLVMFLVLCL